MRLALLAIILAVSTALAGTPLGGDHTGFVPPDTATLRCEVAVAKNGAKFGLALTACHVKAAVVGAAFDEEGCEAKARAKYDAANGRLVGCPACLSPGTLGDQIHSHVDTIVNGEAFCDTASGTPFGGDDDGYIPTAAAAKCETGVAKALAVLTSRLVGCHATLVKVMLAGKPFPGFAGWGEDGAFGCEATWSTKVYSKMLALKGCPPCLSPTITDGLRQAVVPEQDASVGQVYCASPSGAFLD